VEHLRSNLNAADLILDNASTEALEKVSEPQPGGYPYGAFGKTQRKHWMNDDGTPPFQPVYNAGSKNPTGRA
jgi:aryl-alcohol dehydrogenase (NADP+)